MDHAELINSGVIWKPAATDVPEPAQRTIIVTGLGRSGTSMLAAILDQLGILCTDQAFATTLDDREFLHLLKHRQMQDFRSAIAARDRRQDVWAFKLPSLHGYLGPQDLFSFRNPHLVVVFRDVVATARRHAMAEHVDPLAAFFETATGLTDLMRFLQAVHCPILLVSYEKALSSAETLVSALGRFCGVTVDEAQRDSLIAAVRPNNMEYARSARREYEGFVDGILDNHLVGWCRDVHQADPVQLDLLADGKVLASFLANRFRDDLRQAGIGEGLHAFAQSIHGLEINPSAALSVRVSGRNFEVPGSGKRVWQYWR